MDITPDSLSKIAGSVVGLAAGGTFVFLRETGVLKKWWLLGLIGWVSVAGWTFLLWLFVPSILAIGGGALGFGWVLCMVSPPIRGLLRHLGEGWQWPFKSPRKPRVRTLRQEPLTYAQVAEWTSFLAQLRAVIDHLARTTPGIYEKSLRAILERLSAQDEVKGSLTAHPICEQARKLLDSRFNVLGEESVAFKKMADNLSTRITDAQIQDCCRNVRKLVFEYQRLANEFQDFLVGLQNEGVKAIWHGDFWRVNINEGFANDYDRVMTLVKDLRTHTPQGSRNILPEDYQLSDFPRPIIFI